MTTNINCRVPGQVHRVKNCALSRRCIVYGRCVIHEQLQESPVSTFVENGYMMASIAEEVAAMEAYARETDPEVSGGGSLAAKPLLAQMMPGTSQERKDTPVCTGVLDYFPLAVAAVARLSKFGNDKHNPGQPLHWSRLKSSDHADCITRHLIDRGVIDPETGMSHTVEVAWRALALLQEEEEQRLGLPMSRGSR